MKKNSYAILILFIANTLLLTAQSKQTYSNKPLSILGFDKNSTRMEVEQSLTDSNIEYQQYFSDEENWIADAMLNTFGGGATKIYDIKWNDMLFDKIYFLYDSNNRLAVIEMYPEIDAAFVKVKKIFNEITADCPKRKIASFHIGETNDDGDLISILIKNGSNENESAVLTLNEPYVYEFFFNGNQLKVYSELDNW